MPITAIVNTDTPEKGTPMMTNPTNIIHDIYDADGNHTGTIEILDATRPSNPRRVAWSTLDGRRHGKASFITALDHLDGFRWEVRP